MAFTDEQLDQVLGNIGLKGSPGTAVSPTSKPVSAPSLPSPTSPKIKPALTPSGAVDTDEILRRITAAPPDQKKATMQVIQDKAEEQHGVLNKFLNFGKGIVKSGIETATRSLTGDSPVNPVSNIAGPLVAHELTKHIPESIDIPGLGETSLRYSDDPNKAILQQGEDLLNVLPGSKGVKLGAEQLAEQGAEGLAGRLVKSAFRITENDLKKSPTLIKDFLVERFSGLSKRSIAGAADTAVNSLESQLDNVINTTAKEGRKINANEVVKATEGLVDFYKNSAFPEYADVVKNKVAEFVKRGEIPVDVAQEFKKNTYQILKKSYGKLASADTETAKQINRGIKEELEKAIPEFGIADINKKISVFAKARDLMERQINKTGPNELLPLKDLAITGATHQIWPAIARRVIESVPFKTFIANTLTSTKTQALKRATQTVAPIAKEIFRNQEE